MHFFTEGRKLDSIGIVKDADQYEKSPRSILLMGAHLALFRNPRDSLKPLMENCLYIVHIY